MTTQGRSRLAAAGQGTGEASDWADVAALVQAQTTAPFWPGQPASVAFGPDPHGWGAIAARLNADMPAPREGPRAVPPAAGVRGSAEPVAWETIAAQINQEHGV